MGNRIGGNTIGTARVAGRTVTNSGWGVRIDSGADGNRIGEIKQTLMNTPIFVPFGNAISRNGIGGVRVEGAMTLGNRIVYNAIWDHTGLAIDNVTGGNQELPPPILQSLSAGVLHGQVAAGVPSGSLIQVFNDDADEAEVFLGEGLVVGQSFAIAIAAPPLASINATVTHATMGDTSELSSLPVPLAGLEIALGDAGLSPMIATGDSDAPVIPLQLRSPDVVAFVAALELHASGSADDAIDFGSLKAYRDVNEDGVLDPGEPLIGSSAGFDSDDGVAMLMMDDGLVAPGADVVWLLTLEVDPAATVGGMLMVSLPDATSVDAHLGHAGGPPISAMGAYPIEGPDLDVVPEPGLVMGLSSGLALIARLARRRKADLYPLPG